MGRLEGKIAVVTGGTSGIGLAAAHRFVQEGASVFITGRKPVDLDKAVAAIGGDITAVRADSTNLSDLDTLFRAVMSAKGKLDILVASAGLVDPMPFGEISETSFDKTFNLNVRGTMFTAQKALPLMAAGGSIILIGSTASYMGIAGYSTYSATKASLRSFARTWTAELKASGIRVNTLSPGPIDTPIIDSQADSKEGADAIRASFASMIPLGRMGRAEEVANAILFLASDESSFVAGADLSVDGGIGQV